MNEHQAAVFNAFLQRAKTAERMHTAWHVENGVLYSATLEIARHTRTGICIRTEGMVVTFMRLVCTMVAHLESEGWVAEYTTGQSVHFVRGRSLYDLSS